MPSGRNLMLLILLFTMCISCTGNLSSPADHQPSKPEQFNCDLGLALPSPTELVGQVPPERGSSYVETDLMKLGSDFDEGLPHDHAVITDDQLRLAPNYDPGAGHSDLAYSMCPFNIPGYDREPVVCFGWASTPADTSTLYIGFAHWDKDSWDWYQYPGGDQIAIPSFSPYISSSDDLLLVLVAIGTDPWWLDSLRLGAEPAPADWIHSWGGGDYDGCMAIGVDSQEALYCVGNTKSYGVANFDCLLLKFNKYGDFVWARSWGGNGVDKLQAIAIGPDDSIFTAGYTNSFGATTNDCLFQHWTSEGDLDWARTWGANGFERADNLVCTDEALYITGTYTAEGSSNQDIIKLKMSLEGQVLVARPYGRDYIDTTEGMTVYEASPGEYEIHFCGTIGTSETKRDVLYIRWDENMGIQESYQWQGAANEIIPLDIAVAPHPQKRVFIAATEYIDDYWETVTLLEFLPAGTPVAKAWGIDSNYTVYPKAIGVCADGNLVLAGKLAMHGGKVRALLVQASPSAELLSASWFGSDEIGPDFEALALLPDQRVVSCGSTYETIDGAWQDQPLNATSITGSWVSATLTTTILDTTTHTPEGTIVEINTGVIDTGGGETDVLISAKVLN